MTQIELNSQLLAACTADTVDYAHIEALLQRGAEPLGRVTVNGEENNLYLEVVDHYINIVEGVWINTEDGPEDEADYEAEGDPEDFCRITELFLRYGMDISKPAIPYDDDDIVNPLWYFTFMSGEVVLKTLKLLLDHGLRAEDASECWVHEIMDFGISGDLCDPFSFEQFYSYIRKLMLMASYPHVVNADPELRQEIWYDYNHYDLTRFRR